MAKFRTGSPHGGNSENDAIYAVTTNGDSGDPLATHGNNGSFGDNGANGMKMIDS